MRRVMSLYLPDWPTDRLRKTSAYQPDQPLVTARQDGNRRLIAHADAPARKLGLRVGQPVAYAQATIANLQLAEADPAANEAALLRLARWCLRRYSPLVALNEPDGLWMDTTGCDHRFGGEDGLLNDLLEHCAKAGFAAVAVIADTPGAAHAVARYGAAVKVVVLSDSHKAAIAPLPVAALRLPVGIVSALRQLGLERIQQLYEMPRAPLARRLGVAVMRRFDQALGDEPEPLSPIEMPEVPQVTHRLADGATSHDYLRWIIGNLCVELCRIVEGRAHGVRQLDLCAERVGGKRMGVRIGTTRATTNPKHLAKMLGEKVPEIDVGFGIGRLRLIASLTEPFDHRQSAASFGAAPKADVAVLIDVITNRIGPHNLYRAVRKESHVPERSVARIAPLTAGQSVKTQRKWPRPTVLLPDPERIDAIALLPDHAPLQFVWRKDRYRVVRADGPERIFGDWWRRSAEVRAVRDYFRVEDQVGRRFWIFRRGDGVDPYSGSHEWFLHGFFA